MQTQEKFDSITPENLRVLVNRFYARVREDEFLGPIFESVIQDEWESHLAKMTGFWSTVLLGVQGYSGSPLIAHQAVPGIEPEHFVRWLRLFSETTDELFEPEYAERIQSRATRMGKNLTSSLFGDKPFWFMESRQCN